MRKKGGFGRGGFTLVELLMVIVVLSVLVTLGIGAGTRSLKSGRNLKADSMRDALRVALDSYRAQVGRWPCELEPDKLDFSDPEAIYFSTYADEKGNIKVFREIIEAGGARANPYLATEALLTVIGGAPEKGHKHYLKGGTRMSLREAIEKKHKDTPLGYPDPDDPSMFKLYKVVFNLRTDSVTVERQ